MSQEDRAAIRELFRESCHGAGADARWAARDQLEGILARSGQTFPAFFTAHNLDVSAYFASQPISRPTAAGGATRDQPARPKDGPNTEA